MSSLESALAAYYDQDAARRAVREIDPRRVAWRDGFSRRLQSERRSQVLEVGTGPGRDAVAFASDGLGVTGIDISAEHVRHCRDKGIAAYVASVLDLPFADDSFDAGWTMSTLLHVPDARIDDALRELARVLRPGAPLAVGLWGGLDHEGISDVDEIHPPRFFSFRSDERVQQILGRHGTVEEFDTWPEADGELTYQLAIVRVG